MKKMLNILMVLMLMTSISSLAFAEEADEVEIDDETEKQVEAMSSQVGAEIRLLQLEKAITKNIIKGEEAVAVLKEADYNTTELEAILAELELLLEEVQTTDANSTNATQIFIDLKSDAIELTKEFRDTLKELLDKETLEQLRERIREMVCEQVQNLSNKIQNKIKHFNRNQLHRVFGFLGNINESFLEKYQNGTLNMTQVKQQISKKVNQMTKEKRSEIFSELKQFKIQNQIQAKICVENSTEKFQQRKEVRLNNRIKKSEAISDNAIGEEIAQRIRARLNKDNVANTVSEDTGNGNEDPGHENNDNGNSQTQGGSGKQ